MKFNLGITGHTGVLGSEFIKYNFAKKFIKFKGNITKKREIKEWIRRKKINCLFHFAAVVPTKIVKNDFDYANKVNFLGTKYLVDECLKSKNIKWFFFASTSHVYGFSSKKIKETKKTKPISKYGYTKLKAEKYIVKSFTRKKIPYCIGRIFSFTHKKQSEDFVVPSIMKKIDKENYTFENVNHYRDFISTKDICSAIRILFNNKAQGIYNIGSGKKILISDLIKIIARKKNKKILLKKNKKRTCLFADISKIKKLEWKPKKNIASIINDF